MLLLIAVLGILQYHRLLVQPQQKSATNEHELELLRNQVESLVKQVQQSTPKQSSNLNYELAKKIIQTGGDIEDIIQQCEVSRSEAELIAAMVTNNNKQVEYAIS